MKRRLAIGRIVPLCGGALLFVALIWIGPSPNEEEGNWTLGIMATAMSILAGIVLAVFTLLGDPSRLFAGNWRVASAHHRQIIRGLKRYVWLFWMYLAVILGALIAAAIQAYAPDTLTACHVRWIKHTAVSFGFVAIVASFWLPSAVFRAQADRLEEEVKRRRKKPNSDDSG